MKKIYSSIRLLSAVLLSFFVSVNVNAAVPFAGGGTEEDPYLVTDADELYMLRSYTNQSYFFRLENDIDLTEFIQDDSPERGWEPIGSSSSPFCGTFDGNGHTISGLYINSTNTNVGLFGYFKGTIKNLTVKGDVTSTGDNVGGIAGCGSPYSSSVYTKIASCVYEGSVTGKSSVGGICGKIEDTNNIGRTSITGCGFKGTLKSTNSYSGGIIGYSKAAIIDECWVYGSLDGYSVGGICGYGETRIYCCYAKCDIKAYYSGAGIISWLYTVYRGSQNYCSIHFCQFAGTIEAKEHIGGIIHDARGVQVNQCIARGKLISNGSSGTVSGIIGSMSRNTVNNAYVYCRVTSNVSAFDEISLTRTSTATGLTAARITYSSTTDHYIGEEGSSAANLALSAMTIKANDQNVDVSAYANHGSGKSLSALKKQMYYESIGYNFDSMWAIDSELNDGFPYQKVHEPIIRQIAAEEAGGDTPTQINNIQTKQPESDGYYYDLQGRRISIPTTSGIYIKDGKKIVVK